MARDHTRINLDVWGDDEFRELPVDAQNLYWTLWTSPDRTYCGGHWWHPGKLTQFAGDWTIDRIHSAGAVLSERLFLVIDEPVEECLIRSWIKHDGLWKIPNMAVSMANARSAMTSKMCRGVIVHEVKKLASANPELKAWARDEVRNLLSQTALDAAILEPYRGPATGVPTPALTPPLTPAVTPPLRVNPNPCVNPPSNPAPTTATSTSSNSPTEVGTLGRAKNERGHRLPDDWMPSREVIDQMHSEHPHVDLRAEHAKFMDYWLSKPSKDGRRTDWGRTFRNWVRRADENASRRTTQAPNGKVAASDAAFATAQALKNKTSNGLELE